jgi:hypothetical protein
MKSTTCSRMNSSASSFMPVSTGLLQRKCACGGSAGLSGKCEECQKDKLPLSSGAVHQSGPAPAQHIDAPGSGHHFSRVRVHRDETGSGNLSSVHRSTVHGGEGDSGKTNRRFDTFAITERDLSDPDIIARLNALSKVGLIQYRKNVKDLAVIEYITSLIDKMSALPPCTAEEATETSKQAEAARVGGLPYVTDAVKALGTVVDSSVLCAFSSNFNTAGNDPLFQTRRMIVERRLNALSSKMKTAVPFKCVPADDPVCMKPGQGDTAAFVFDHKPPINFCPSFRNWAGSEPLQQSIVIHEYAHLVGNVDDSGGYSMMGNTVGTCGVGTKFKAPGDVLINTADALTGFVMHIGLGMGAPTASAASTGTAVATAEEAGTLDGAPGANESDSESAFG